MQERRWQPIWFIVLVPLVATVVPLGLARLGFVFSSVADGGAGAHLAALHTGTGLLRLDLPLVGVGLSLAVLATAGYRVIGSRFTLLLSLTIAWAAMLVAISWVPTSVSDLPGHKMTLQVQTDSWSRIHVALMVAAGVMITHKRRRLGSRLALCALNALGLFLTVSQHVVSRSDLVPPQGMQSLAPLLAAWTCTLVVVSWSGRSQGGQPRFLGLSVVTALGLFLASVVCVEFARQGTLAGGEEIGDLLRWLASIMPLLGLCLDLVLGAFAVAQEREKRFLHAIIDNIPFLVAVRDEEERVDLVNAPLARFCGRTVGELERGAANSGSRLPAWLNEGFQQDLDARPDVDQAVPAGEHCTEVVDPDGERRALLINHRLFRSLPGGPVKRLTLGQDMTEQHQAELNLARGLVAERTQTSILRMLARGRHEDFATDLEKALGQVADFCRADAGLLCRREGQGMVRVIACAARPGGPRVPEMVTESVFGDAIPRLEQDQPVFINNLRQDLQGTQGRTFVWNSVELSSLILVPVFDQGELWGCIGVHSRRPHKTWDNLEIHLLRVVAEVMSAAYGRYRAETSLQEAMAQAHASSEAKSQFLANMSHEIRTPLNCVMGLSEHLFDLDPTAEQRECLNMIRHSGDVLLNVINDVLDLARIESGKVQIQELDLDLPALLANTLGMFRARAQEKGLDLVLDLDPELPQEVLGDEIRLSQILTNLLGNALKFTAEGSVTLHVQPVGPSGGDPRPWIRFAVQDTGIGIAADKLEAVFESFTQADASTTRNYGGTGLGLAICRSLATLMGGTLTAASDTGGGSVFTLEIPMTVTDRQVAREVVAAPQLAETPLPEVPAGCRVLVVEDNLMNQAVARRLLASLDCEIFMADHGQQALDMLAEIEVDLVLMDYMMPGMDGPETTRRLRQQGGRLADLPVVALTANAMGKHKQECLEAGMDGFLTKPIRKAELAEVIASAARPVALV